MIEDSNAAFYIGLNQKSNFSQDIISLSITTILEAIVDLPQEFLLTFQPKLLPTSSTLQDRQENRGVVALCHQPFLSWKKGISQTDKIFSLTSIL
jgi:hypothetical protein